MHSCLKDIKSLNTYNIYTWRYLNLVYVYIFFFIVSKSHAKNWWFSILKTVVLSMHIVFAALYLLEWRDFSEKHKISKLYYGSCSVWRISFHFRSRTLVQFFFYSGRLLLFIQLKVFFRLWTLYTSKTPLRHVFQSFCQMLM